MIRYSAKTPVAKAINTLELIKSFLKELVSPLLTDILRFANLYLAFILGATSYYSLSCY